MDMIRGQFFLQFFLCLFRKRLTIGKIPCLGTETVFAVVAAAGHKQRYPNTHAVFNTEAFDISVIHTVTCGKEPAPDPMRALLAFPSYLK